MAAPRIHRTDEGSSRADRAALHEMACAFAEESFARHGEAPIMWLIAKDNDVLWLETPWEDERQKWASIQVVKMLLTTRRAHAYAQICEAWVAVRPTDAPDGPPPAQGPDHESILMVLSADRDGEQTMTRWLVTERRTGPNFLGPRVDDAETRFAGRLFSLFSKSDGGPTNTRAEQKE